MSKMILFLLAGNSGLGYSPLGRGFFSSGPKMMVKLEEGDFRMYLPRLQPENLGHSKILFERVNEIAAKKGCTPDTFTASTVASPPGKSCGAIPGTTKIENLEQNISALSVKLTPEEIVELESIASADSVKGIRYGAGISTYLDSETPQL